MATSQQTISTVTGRKSDPLIRGFEQQNQHDATAAKSSTSTSSTTITTTAWGPAHQTQNPNWKFCRFQVCSQHSFGHTRTSSNTTTTTTTPTTPHAFEATNLLHKLATDPGIVAILIERELIVGTLAELEPIDDRLAAKKKAQNPNSCLLGYNTNHGTRIDLKLRPDTLEGFYPYCEIAATLLHELSHNWGRGAQRPVLE